MADFSVFGDYQNPVQFDPGVAEDFSAQLRWTSQRINIFNANLSLVQSTASRQFRGFFAEVFSRNMKVCSQDATELSEALTAAADQVDYLAEQAKLENQRREQVRDYVSAHDDWWEKGWDWLAGTDAPPSLAPAEPPATPPLNLPFTQPRQQDRSIRGASGGVTSANPSDLARAAGILGDAAADVPPGSTLRADHDSFCRACRYGQLVVGDLFEQLDRWRELNTGDVNWLNAVAKAFEAAGGSGTLSLPNSAIKQSLRANGASVNRPDLDITVPALAGIDPATGYMEDPINSATGNFVEPEIDLGFDGVGTALVVERVYNSIQAAQGVSGVLGPGWSCVADQCLTIETDHLEWVRPDGRHVVFTAPADSSAVEGDPEPIRAAEENAWLSHVDSSELPGFADVGQDASRFWLVSDNRGGRWVFTETGIWVCSGSSTTDVVRAHREHGRLSGLDTAWGRRITFSYDDAGLLAGAATNDGRRVRYTHDDRGRLVQVDRPDGCRRYEWDGTLVTRVIDAAGVCECVNTYDERGRIAIQQTADGRLVHVNYLPGGVTAASDADGTRANTWIGDARGRTVAVIDSDGGRVSMIHDRFGNLLRTVDRTGAVTTHHYDERGRCTHTGLPTGASIDYSWDALDRLATARLDNGATTTFTYVDTSRGPASITDPVGGVTRLEWTNGLLVGTTNPVGVTLKLGYDAHGDLVSLTDSAGSVTRLVRDEAGRIVEATSPAGATTRLSYDDAGRLTCRVDPDGATWTHRRDQGGRLVELVAPDGGVIRWGYGTDGRLTSVTDPAGRVIDHVFDDLGNLSGLHLPDDTVWSFDHDALSRLTGLVCPDGATWGYGYDVDGNLTRVTDPCGGGQIFSTTGTAQAISTPTGRILDRVDTDIHGLPATHTNVTGASECLTRDLAGRVIEYRDPAEQTTRYDRDLAGRITRVVSPTGLVTSYHYDACGRRDAVTDPAGGVTRYTYTADGQVATVTDPTGEIAYYGYDPCGRLTASQVPGAGMSQWRYDRCGRLIFADDLVEGPRHFRYDTCGQLVASTNPAGGVTRYSYDRCGRLVSSIDPAGGLTTYHYDSCGRLTELTDPLGRTTQYTWDAVGSLVSVGRPDGTVLTHRSGPDGIDDHIDDELVTRTLTDASTRTICIDDHAGPVTRRHILTYDPRGLLLTHTSLPVAESDEPGTGQEASDRGGSGVVSEQWVYDDEARLRRHVTAADETIEYDYDAAGRLATIRHTRLGDVRLDWDGAGRLTDLASRSSRQHWSYTDGFVTSHTGPAGSTTIGRDETGRVTELSTPDGHWYYAYDGSGALAEVHTPEAALASWAYDTCGRLTTAVTGDATRRFTYDAAGQLATVTHTADGATRNIRYRYDSCGRRVEATDDVATTTYTWDRRGWLAGLTSASGTGTKHWSVRVDAFGCPIEVTSPGGHSRLDWDVNQHQPSLQQADDTPVMALPDGGLLTSDEPDGAWRHPDIDPADPYHLASRLLTTALGHTGAHPTLGGLVWMGERLYDPETASFLTPDPQPAPTGALWQTSSYAYAANSPLTLADPMGRNPVTDAQMRQFTDTLDLQGWWGRHGHDVLSWQTGVGVGLMVVGGILTLVPIPGLGEVLLGAGLDMTIQKVTTGHVDGVEVALSGALAPIGGFALGKTATPLAQSAVARGVTLNGMQGFTMGNYHWATSPSPHNARSYASQVGGETLSGVALGALTVPAGNRIGQPIYDAMPEAIPLGHFDGARSYDIGGPGKLRKFARGVTGQLTTDDANSFRSSSYDRKLSLKPFPVYRAWGGVGEHSGKEVGRFVSRTRPTGPMQARLDSALVPQWGNAADHVTKFPMPTGRIFYEGATGEQPTIYSDDPAYTLGQLPGGGNQIMFKKIPKEWKRQCHPKKR
ncbi:MAG: DUF6531 domain-containing protein [Cutibacterium granulosum]|uniref:DUF6531 domain-containing protein n=1 Tax=Cutibacterium granulosum TaxID=33011 RepID=UPI002B2305A7|nr:DUF6531 domain-containing protein [Cutibacterium granulosum]MEA5645641.1 DUF6531 domain-containing protein [Cutibacterium granulosum]